MGMRVTQKLMLEETMEDLSPPGIYTCDVTASRNILANVNVLTFCCGKNFDTTTFDSPSYRHAPLATKRLAMSKKTRTVHDQIEWAMYEDLVNLRFSAFQESLLSSIQ